MSFVRLAENIPGIGWLFRALSSSVGQKLVMAVTGLLLCGFLVAHLGGNILLFVGKENYNDYAHTLHKNEWLLRIAEVGLVSLFFSHVYLALSTTAMNKKARKDAYMSSESKQGMTILPGGGASSYMFVTGAIVLGFVLLHLVDFTFEWRPDVDYSKFTMKDDSGHVVADAFTKAKHLLSNPLSGLVYIIGCAALGIHLVHGFRSALTTLGLGHPKYNTLVRMVSMAFGWAIGIGFISFVFWSWAT